jgi:hypothetical protein
MKCTHCDKTIGCGCNKAVAGDGSTVCKGCLNVYNQTLTSTTTTTTTPFNPGVVVIPPTTAR